MPLLQDHFCQVLLADHRQTESALASLKTLLEAEQLEKADETFISLKNELYRHFFCEEHALFPVLSQYRTMVLMEVEHDDLLETQQAFEESLKTSLESGKVVNNLNPLFLKWEEQLRCHIDEEEKGIFPLAQSALEPEEKALVARKLHETSLLASQTAEPTNLLKRPSPTFKRHQTDLFCSPNKPIQYQKLFEADHASLHHVQLQAGQSLKYHWSPESQCLIVLSGDVLFLTPEQEIPLTPGEQVTLEPRFCFSIKAQTDSHLLISKVWPHPHFIRTP